MIDRSTLMMPGQWTCLVDGCDPVLDDGDHRTLLGLDRSAANPLTIGVAKDVPTQ